MFQSIGHYPWYSTIEGISKECTRTDHPVLLFCLILALLFLEGTFGVKDCPAKGLYKKLQATAKM